MGSQKAFLLRGLWLGGEGRPPPIRQSGLGRLWPHPARAARSRVAGGVHTVGLPPVLLRLSEDLSVPLLGCAQGQPLPSLSLLPWLLWARTRDTRAVDGPSAQGRIVTRLGQSIWARSFICRSLRRLPGGPCRPPSLRGSCGDPRPAWLGQDSGCCRPRKHPRGLSVGRGITLKPQLTDVLKNSF